MYLQLPIMSSLHLPLLIWLIPRQVWLDHSVRNLLGMMLLGLVWEPPIHILQCLRIRKLLKILRNAEHTISWWYLHRRLKRMSNKTRINVFANYKQTQGFHLLPTPKSESLGTIGCTYLFN
ncbi:hypothetical protein Pint_07588 [Pistacia integerrima]|uniref:Uncharacterized protein n=1 Tax=Pistacia integerrima TaxID=434235 RepID=A0ACC0XXT0_9ROSI|nr:hypothetical protein Pint_07588 [Pistacia integerrima]